MRPARLAGQSPCGVGRVPLRACEPAQRTAKRYFPEPTRETAWSVFEQAGAVGLDALRACRRHTEVGAAVDQDADVQIHSAVHLDRVEH